MIAKIDVSLAHARPAGVEHVRERSRANAHACVTIRGVEERVRELFESPDGVTAFLGAPNLLPDGDYKAWRVLTVGKFGASEYLPRDGRSVLVVTDEGRFAWASRVDVIEDGQALVAARERLVTDDEILAAWLAPFVRTVQEALEVHLQKIRSRGATYEKANEFAQRLSKAIGLHFRR